jgi:hypothetical protein
MNDGKIASGSDFVRDLGVAIRENPIPSALIGMGLAWLLTGGRSSANAGFGWARDRVIHFRWKDDAAASPAEGLDRSAVAQKASDAVSSLGATMPQLGAAVPQSLADARSQIADLMRRQPLMLGAVGLALGAGVAASMRSTAMEADLLGEASANAQERAHELAAAAARRATEVATDVTAAIGEEARAQDLTPDRLRQSAREATRKVQNVIDQSAERLRSRLN